MAKHYFTTLLFSFSMGLWAQIGGREVFPFLNITPEARVAAMGGNPIAYYNPDVNFALLNPALIHDELHGNLSLNYVNYTADIMIGSANYAHHFDKVGTFTLGIKTFQYGDFIQANQFGVIEGDFTVNDFVMSVGFGREIYKNLNVGANLKVINSTYERYSSFGMAMDVGFNYYLPEKRLSMSLLAKNMGVQFNPYESERGQLPFDLQIAVSNRFEHVPLRWHITVDQLHRPDVSFINPANATRDPATNNIIQEDISLTNKVLRHFSFGGELAPTKGFNIAIGYNYRTMQEMKMNTRRSSAGISFGVGLKVNRFMVQYARSTLHVSGSTNMISITTRFADFKKKEKKEDENKIN